MRLNLLLLFSLKSILQQGKSSKLQNLSYSFLSLVGSSPSAYSGQPCAASGVEFLWSLSFLPEQIFWDWTNRIHWTQSNPRQDLSLCHISKKGPLETYLYSALKTENSLLSFLHICLVPLCCSSNLEHRLRAPHKGVPVQGRKVRAGTPNTS